MFNIWSFSGLGAVVSSGLGGGSLIYANVLIRKDEKWFVEEDPGTGKRWDWPVQYTDLECHYERVEQILAAQEYPFHLAPYNETPKTNEFKAAAEQRGLDWSLPNLAVTFANKGKKPVPGQPIYEAEDRRNLHNLPRLTCRLVGECDIGCNFGSKNSLDYNYLSEANRLGAKINTLCEVLEFEPLPGRGYAIRYAQRDELDPDRKQQIKITADRLILSAGTFGSTYLLLKMKHRNALPGISRRLGTRFNSNGDLITFALKCRKRDPSGDLIPRVIEAGYGPVITSTVRVPDKEDGGEGRGFYVQEAGYPEFVNWMLNVVDTPSVVQNWWHEIRRHLADRRLNHLPETDVGGEVSRLFGKGELSAGSLPLLGMGRDIPDGRLMLRGGKLDLDWSPENSREYFDGVREKMREIAESLGAKRFVDNLALYLTTVHPLGGCPMGRGPEEGVVDSCGAVFGHEDLYVADGSVMPGPVGPNPSLTIAALADRFADHIIARHRGEIG
jgi:cholesterol oxidase